MASHLFVLAALKEFLIIHEIVFSVCRHLHNKSIFLEDRAPLIGKEEKVLREILIIWVDEPRRIHKFQQGVFTRVIQTM